MARTLTIQEVAKATGTTSRTLRHYDAIGLLRPSEIAVNGYRRYDTTALIRLQRILTLRDLGMSLAQIQAVLDRDIPETQALAQLEQQLMREAKRLDRQIGSVRRTLETLLKGDIPVANEMFDGFDHNEYKQEVEERWGADAFRRSNDWWNSLGEAGQQAYQQKLTNLITSWKDAHKAGVTPESETAQLLAKQQVDWLRETPGPHTTGECSLETYVRNLGDMYVNDPRFAANFGGTEVATLVRDALHIYVG